MSDCVLLVIGYFLGAILGYLVCAVLTFRKDEPKPHTTCKDCIHRDTDQCPFYHLKPDERVDRIGYRKCTDKPDDFYCKEAQDRGVAARRKQGKL